jgi:hypothetical protein
MSSRRHICSYIQYKKHFSMASKLKGRPVKFCLEMNAEMAASEILNLGEREHLDV